MVKYLKAQLYLKTQQKRLENSIKEEFYADLLEVLLIVWLLLNYYKRRWMSILIKL